MSKKRRFCPYCKSSKTIKYGKLNNVQTYLCNNCKKRFRSQRRNKNKLIKELWFDYVFKKQTLRELAKTYSLDKRIIRDYLNQYTPPLKDHRPRLIHLLVDATYFGLRKEGEYWCVLVARDYYSKENIAWLFTDTETTSAYLALREQIKSRGYTILSVTGDGFEGIKQAFLGIPYQMCQVHMERLVTTGTTRNPQTKAGQVCLALARTIHKTNSHQFYFRLKQYFKLYNDFLNEKSFNEISGRREWTHRELKRASSSLVRLRKYLFTYEHNENIPKNTNSLEGHFSHLKNILEIHRGLNKRQAQKIINSILLASTIAPSPETKKKTI